MPTIFARVTLMRTIGSLNIWTSLSFLGSFTGSFTRRLLNVYVHIYHTHTDSFCALFEHGAYEADNRKNAYDKPGNLQ